MYYTVPENIIKLTLTTLYIVETKILLNLSFVGLLEFAGNIVG